MKKKHRNLVVAKLLKKALEGPYFASTVDIAFLLQGGSVGVTDDDRQEVMDAYAKKVAPLEKWVRKQLDKWKVELPNGQNAT